MISYLMPGVRRVDLVPYARGAQIPGTKSLCRLSFVRWRQMCVWVLSMELASCHPFGSAILGLFLDFWKSCAPLSHALRHVEELFSGRRRLARIQMKPATFPSRTVQTSSNKYRGVKNDTPFSYLVRSQDRFSVGRQDSLRFLVISVAAAEC